MKLLVIGAQGQLARALAQKAALHESISLLAAGRPECDLTEPDTIARTLQKAAPDLVVNAAAYTAVDKAESDEEAAFAVNAHGPAELARLCAQRHIPLIHVSTDYVFDGGKDTPYVEDDPIAPLGVYGCSKAEGERLVAEACPRHVILRTAWVYSPWGHNFLKTMLRLARERDTVSVVGDQIGSPTCAPHLAQAILSMAKQLMGAESSGVWGIYHAAGSGEATWHDFAAAIFEEAAKHGLPAPTLRKITTAEYPTPARRPANSRLSCARLEKTFGIRLPHWREGVRECVEILLREGEK